MSNLDTANLSLFGLPEAASVGLISAFVGGFFALLGSWLAIFLSERNARKARELDSLERETANAIIGWNKVRSIGAWAKKIKSGLDARYEEATRMGFDLSDPATFVEPLILGRDLPEEIRPREIAFLLKRKGGPQLFDQIIRFENNAHLARDIVRKFNAEREAARIFIENNSTPEGELEGTIGSFTMAVVPSKILASKNAAMGQLIGELYVELSDLVEDGRKIFLTLHSEASCHFGGAFARIKVDAEKE